MHYQVIARSCVPSGTWDYYPYWAPGRDKEAATRLANYAAQTGYEATILQSITVEMLQHIARNIVEHQDTSLLPSVRYLPGAGVATASAWRRQNVDTEVQPLEEDSRRVAEPNFAGPNKVVLDARRLSLEQGPGGDVTLRAGWQPQQVSFPRQMDVLRAWMHLRRRLLQGQVGNALDGAPDDVLDDEEIQQLEDEFSA